MIFLSGLFLIIETTFKLIKLHDLLSFAIEIVPTKQIDFSIWKSACKNRCIKNAVWNVCIYQLDQEANIYSKIL